MTVAPRTADSSSPVQAVPPQRHSRCAGHGGAPRRALRYRWTVWWPIKPRLASATRRPRRARLQPRLSHGARVGAADAFSCESAWRRVWGRDADAARCLASFLDKVRVEQEPPLIASPPQQRTAVRRPPPVRPRSSWIAAQPLAHIPASKRGEVLLNRRLGIAPPTSPDSPVPRGIFDALRTRTLSSSEVEGLDALFPALNGHARASSSGRTRRWAY